MTKNKKISITICTLMLITLCYFMPTFIRSNYSVVRADSSVDFDDTKYTDSDQLLKKRRHIFRQKHTKICEGSSRREK